MNKTKTSVLVISMLAAVMMSSSAAAVTVEFTHDLPSTQQTDEEFPIEGVATGSNVEEIWIQKSIDGGGWSVIASKDIGCYGDKCSIKHQESHSEPENVEYRIKGISATDRDESNPQDVDFYRTSDRNVYTAFTQFPSEPTYTENSYPIKAYAHDDAGKLGYQKFELKYRRKTPYGWTLWNTFETETCEPDKWGEKVKDCRVSGSFTPDKGQRTQIQAITYTSDGKTIKADKYMTPEIEEELATIVDTGSSTSGNEAILFIELDETVGSEYECFWSKNKIVSEAMDNKMDKVSGDRFEDTFSFSEGTHKVWFNCFKNGRETNEDPIKHGFTVSETEPRLQVNVQDSQGNDLNNAEVTVERLIPTETHTKTTDSDGNVPFYGLEPDTYRIIAKCEGESVSDSEPVGSYDKEVSLKFNKNFLDNYCDTTEEPPEPEPPTCDIDPGSLSLSDTDIQQGEEVTTSITVTNFMDQKQKVEVTFKADGQSKEFTRKIAGNSNEPFSHSFTLHQDADVSVRVDTEGYNCGYENKLKESQSVTVEADEDDEDDGDDTDDDTDEERHRLTVEVEDEDGDDIEDAEVEVSKDEDDDDFDDQELVESDDTDDDGEAEFELEPDTYDVRVSKDGYRTEIEQDVEIEDQDEEIEFTLETEDDDLSIDTIAYSSSVCRGEDLQVNVMVSNNLGYDEHVTLRGEGLGSITQNSFDIESGEIRFRSLVFENVRRETVEEDQSFTITLENGGSDYTTRMVDVVDCPFQKPSRPATGISLQLSPSNEVTSGHPVTVSGYVDGVREGKEVDISLNGFLAKTVDTDPSGYYEATLEPRTIGLNTITASTDSWEKTRSVEVDPTTYISNIYAPDKAFQGKEFEVCGQVGSQVIPSVHLLKNGKRLDTKKERGRVCFDVEENELGTHEYAVRTVVSGDSGILSKEVKIQEQGEEVSSFPDKIATVESNSGVIKVTLYNTNEATKNYDLSIEGLPEEWFSQTQKQVTLTSGEKREVFFYFTPKQKGSYEAELEVESGGEVLHEQTIEISSMQKAQTEKSIFQSLTKLFGL